MTLLHEEKRLTMKFEVKRDNRVIMQTEQEICVPDRAERDVLRKAGLKLYKDGKVFKEAKK